MLIKNRFLQFWQNFVRVIGHNENDFYLPHLLSIVEAMVGEREVSSLDAQERKDLEALLCNIAEIEKRIDDHQKRVLSWSWKKEIFFGGVETPAKGIPLHYKGQSDG